MSNDSMVTFTICRKPCPPEPTPVSRALEAGQTFVIVFTTMVLCSGAAYGSVMAYRRLRRVLRKRFR